jgi:hypothetical protein
MGLNLICLSVIMGGRRSSQPELASVMSKTWMVGDGVLMVVTELQMTNTPEFGEI